MHRCPICRPYSLLLTTSPAAFNNGFRSAYWLRPPRRAASWRGAPERHESGTLCPADPGQASPTRPAFWRTRCSGKSPGRDASRRAPPRQKSPPATTGPTPTASKWRRESPSGAGGSNSRKALQRFSVSCAAISPAAEAPFPAMSQLAAQKNTSLNISNESFISLHSFL